ncbi:hypothetical protein BC629DRAFT_1536307 [Irpex lacteus]|nr:hypothetical protein BC629DRAFT_1536307 [Irpex lacteus]
MIEREREALVGLAIAEASALWQLSGRPTDTYGLRDCLESAALTASRIAWQVGTIPFDLSQNHHSHLLVTGDGRKIARTRNGHDARLRNLFSQTKS